MAIGILAGGGLATISILYFITNLVAETIRGIYAFRVCPELKVKYSLVRKKYFKEVLRFGSKSYLLEITPGILIQSTAILVATYLGPALLSIYNRPVALMLFVQTFVSRIAMVLIPTVGSMQVSDDVEGIRKLLFDATKYSFAIVLPCMLFFIVFGDSLIEIWMGPEYVIHELIIVLSLGYLLVASQKPALTVLEGMNRHGKMSIITFLVAVPLFILGALFLNYQGWTVTSAAMNMSIPMLIAFGIILPIYACRLLNIALSQYISQSFFSSLIPNILFLTVLIIFKITLKDTVISLIVAALVGGGIILTLYWKNLIPAEYKRRILTKLRFKRAGK
jgi:O-antigen/teichoic acid export membrane protein